MEFVLASDLYRDDDEYWATVIEVSKNTTLARMQRSISIMGRQERESIDFAKLIYPAMQAADIFTLGVHIAHAGMDQRKAHVIARDVATQMRIHAVRGDRRRADETGCAAPSAAARPSPPLGVAGAAGGGARRLLGDEDEQERSRAPRCSFMTVLTRSTPRSARRSARLAR